MKRMCREYRMVVRMLEARGTEDFGLISQELYGAASDASMPVTRPWPTSV